MHGLGTKLAFWATLASVPACASAALPADKFCTQIRAIVADAPNGFAAFKGPQTKLVPSDEIGGNRVDYAASGTPDGADSCQISMQEKPTADGEYIPDYECEFPISGHNKGLATRKLATRVAACIPDMSHPTGPGLSLDSGMLDAHSKDYAVSYSFLSGPSSSTIGMLIQSDRR